MGEITPPPKGCIFESMISGPQQTVKRKREYLRFGKVDCWLVGERRLIPQCDYAQRVSSPSVLTRKESTGRQVGQVVRTFGPWYTDGGETLLCVHTMAFTRDMKQQSDNSGFGSSLVNRGCSKCYFTKNQKRDLLLNMPMGHLMLSPSEPLTPCDRTKKAEERRERREAEERKERMETEICRCFSQRPLVHSSAVA